jgi:hypothetical protein
MKRTADWCPKCGDFGWDIFKGIEKEYKDQPVLVLAVHSSGNLRTPTSLAITENYGGFGQPIFYVNGIEAFWPTNVTQDGIDTIKSMINKGISSQGNLLSMGTSIVRTGELSYKLEASIKLNASVADSKYYIAHYLVNDHKEAYQENQGASAIHTGYLSSSLTGSPFGDLIINGNLERDKIISQTLESVSIDVPANEFINHRIVTIIWKVNAKGKFDFVEARSLALGDIKVGVIEDDVSEINMKSYVQHGRIVVESNKRLYDTRAIHVVNTLGQILSSSYNMTSSETIELELFDHRGGMHFIQVFTNKIQIIIPIFLPL